MSRDSLKIRVLVTKETYGDSTPCYSAVGLDRWVVGSGATYKEAMESFMRAMVAELTITEDEEGDILASVPPAPATYWQMWNEALRADAAEGNQPIFINSAPTNAMLGELRYG